MVDINRVKAEFERIKNLGFIESDRPFAEKNDGAIGNTFETIRDLSEIFSSKEKPLLSNKISSQILKKLFL